LANANLDVHSTPERAERGDQPQRFSIAVRLFDRSAALEGDVGVLPRCSVRSRIARPQRRRNAIPQSLRDGRGFARSRVPGEKKTRDQAALAIQER
jgi:hypothetical protein